jgi:mannose-1-phosphate guanylyltransferase
MMASPDRKQRWGLILAGGDGVRLRPLTRFISRDERPKQFCPLYGEATLLEQARTRAERSIFANQILYSLNRDHEKFYLHSLFDCPAQRVIQPSNRGTAPAILTGLRLIADREKDACVAILPSDHYFSDNERFNESLETAFALANRYHDHVILLGAVPDRPETEYGWIKPATALAAAPGTYRVGGFEEKPCLPAAQTFLERGCLWNTFIMVGKIQPFLEMIGVAVPQLLKMFGTWHLRQAPGEELRIGESVYDAMPNLDFSRKILSADPSRLLVHRLDDVGWNDLGDCDRAVAALSYIRNPPAWIEPWRVSAQRACA